jgi:hypothetical protein
MVTSKVAVDTEAGSSNLYAHLGSYNVLKPGISSFPWRYMEAIDLLH